MNKIKYLFAVLVFAFAFSSCEDELEPMSTPFVAFEIDNQDVALTAGEKKTLDIKVFAVNTSGSNRTYDVVSVLPEKDADKYKVTIPKEVVIPAGKNEGVISVEVENLGLSYVEKLPITIFLQGKPGNFTDGTSVFNVYSACAEYDFAALNGKTIVGQDDWKNTGTPNTEKVTMKYVAGDDKNDAKFLISGLGCGFLKTNGKYNLSATEVFEVPVVIDEKTGKIVIPRTKACIAAAAYEIYLEGTGMYIPCADVMSFTYKILINFKGEIMNIGNFVPDLNKDTEYTLHASFKLN